MRSPNRPLYTSAATDEEAADGSRVATHPTERRYAGASQTRARADSGTTPEGTEIRAAASAVLVSARGDKRERLLRVAIAAQRADPAACTPFAKASSPEMEAPCAGPTNKEDARCAIARGANVFSGVAIWTPAPTPTSATPTQPTPTARA